VTYSKELLSLVSEVFRHFENAFLDILIELLDVIIIIGWYSDQHLIENDTNLVNISRLSDSLLFEHLWGQVCWAPAKRLSN
jgi:hypothetical protein